MCECDYATALAGFQNYAEQGYAAAQIQPRGQVRQRRGCARGTTQRRCGGTASPPRRVTRRRAVQPRAHVRLTARACPRTTPRRCGGSASPPSRATPSRSPTSYSCTPTARACPRTTPRRRGGSASLPSRAAPAAQFYLGLMYASGEGVPKDDAEAARWFRLAAEQGYARRAVQPRAHVRQRRGRARGRRRGGAVVPPRRRAGLRHARSPTSGSCTPSARACPRTT